MSQASSLNIYFVLPEEDKDAQCSNDMSEAFSCVKQYAGKPRWVLPSFCLSHRSKETDVYVFDKFEGPAFEKLKNDAGKHVLLGSRCMLTCMIAGDTIPPGISPVFTDAMRDLFVVLTGFCQKKKKHLIERIQYMGGLYDPSLRTATTHVVAANSMSLKAIQAQACGKPVMAEEWIEAVWSRSLEACVRGSDDEFLKYRVQLFHNIRATTSGLSKKEKELVGSLIKSHGGFFSGVLTESETDILFVKLAEGEKFKAAKSWKIPCVLPEWIHKCLESGKTVSYTSYIVNDSISKKASTPLKGDVTLSANFSTISAIAPDGKNLTHLEESCAVEMDGTVRQPPTPKPNSKSHFISQTLDGILANIKSSGHFLDGCNVFTSGCQPHYFEKLKKILNLGGATRFDEMTRSVTHIIFFSSFPEELIDFGAHILPIGWLAESARLGAPAPVEDFIVLQTVAQTSAPPSPLSKQGALLLSRPEPTIMAFDPDPTLNEPPPEDELLNKYNLSQQGDRLGERVVENIAPAKLTPSQSQTPLTQADYFQGMRFFLSPEISEEELESSEELIAAAGGIIVTKKFSGVPNYAIVPISGAGLGDVTAKEVVNLLYLKDCHLNKAVVPTAYYHLPVTIVKDATPLTGCVIAVSQYHGSERDFVECLVDLLGGTVQSVLSRKVNSKLLQSTHLICSEPSGVKYEGAVRWCLPVVHHSWLFKCAESGRRISEEQFLIGESKMPCTDATKSVISSDRSRQQTPLKRDASENIDPDRSSKISKLTNTSTDCEVLKEQNPGTSNHSRVSNESRMTKTAVSSFPLEPTVAKSPSNILAEGTTVPLPQSFELESHASPLALHRDLESHAPPLVLPRDLECHASPSPLPRDLESHASPLPLPRDLESHAPSPFNRVVERIKNMGTPRQSPGNPDPNRTLTPNSPFGAFLGNPSPRTKKNLYKWMHQGAELPLDPPVKPFSEANKPATPISELLSRQLKLMMRKPEEQPPNDSPLSSPLAKRLHLSTDSPNARTSELMTGLQKMREIEENYSKTNLKLASPMRTTVEETNLLIVAESQPHTEVGWDDPSEKDNALNILEKSVELSDKIFMVTGFSEEESEEAKKIILESGGKVASLPYFDKNATHLIGGSNMTRAEKLMGSIATGTWIIHPLYLEQLKKVRNVHHVHEEDYEWGNMSLDLPRGNLTKTVKDCVQIAYQWRIDIKVNKKPPPFQGMEIIFALSPSKYESFKRMVEASGAQVIGLNSAKGGPNCVCVCDSSGKQKLDLKFMAKKNIKCVSCIFINDIILKKPLALENNLLT